MEGHAQLENTKIAFTSDRSGNAEVYVMDSDGANVVRLTNHPGSAEPSWSPDGRRIVFNSSRDPEDGDYEDLYVMDSDGANVERLTDYPASDYHPSWSPDGTRIAFTSERDGNMEIYVLALDGGHPLNLTNHPGDDGSPAWSPDCGRIVFTSTREEDHAIYVMNADGSGQEQLTHDGPAGEGVFSFDALRILYTGYDHAVGQGDGPPAIDVYVMDADGSNSAPLTTDPAPDGGPAWSPDGAQIVFQAKRDGSSSIFVMNADGSSQTPLTDSTTQDYDAAWSPFLR